MPALKQLDLRLLRALGCALRDASDRTGLPLHPVCFWSVIAAYSAVWWLLCGFDQHPEWMWFLLGPAMGMVATYLADTEPVGLLDDRVGLSHLGADPRWSLMRVLYLPVLAVLLLQAWLSGQFGAAMAGLLAVEAVLFFLLECLLAIRILAADHPLMQALAALKAAMAEAQAAEAAEVSEPTPPETR